MGTKGVRRKARLRPVRTFSCGSATHHAVSPRPQPTHVEHVAVCAATFARRLPLSPRREPGHWQRLGSLSIVHPGGSHRHQHVAVSHALCLEYLAVCIPKSSLCIIGSVLCLTQPLGRAATAVRFSAGLRSGLVLIPSGLLVRPIASSQSRIAGQQQPSRAPQMVWFGSHMHNGKNPLHALNDRQAKWGLGRRNVAALDPWP